MVGFKLENNFRTQGSDNRRPNRWFVTPWYDGIMLRRNSLEDMFSDESWRGLARLVYLILESEQKTPMSMVLLSPKKSDLWNGESGAKIASTV